MKKLLLSLASLSLLAASPILVRADDKTPDDNSASITGEILDMACYTDHGAHGEKTCRLRAEMHRQRPARRHQKRR